MKYIRQQYALLLIAGLTAGAPAQALNGSGSAGDPFVINTPADLEEFAQNVNSGTTYSTLHIQLTAHIDISYRSWQPIGTAAYPFSGHFNGGGHRITGLQADMGNADYAGLFGYVHNGTIDSVGVILHPNGVKGRNYVGGLAGYVHSTITGAGADITACYVIGSVQGSANVGGLAGGYNYLDNNSDIRYILSCFAAGKVSGTTNIGGLVGENRGVIQSSYSTANVQGGANVGGIAGLNRYRINHCYAVGAVSGTADVGSVAGRNDGGSFALTFYDPAMTGSPNGVQGSNSTGGVSELTQDNRYAQATYLSWDFAAIWTARWGVSYPYFVWQSAPAAVNVLYRDSVVLNIMRPADSITAYRGARMERLCAITPVQTAGSVPFALPCAADIGDTLYFVVWERGRQPSPPVRAVVQKYPLAVGAGGNASSLYGNAIDPALCRRAGGILRQGHTLQCSAALDAPPDSLTPSGHIRTGIYRFVFYDKKVMAGGVDVTHLYEITSALNTSQQAEGSPLWNCPLHSAA